jgi:AcrR family transcriptional regulator
LESPERSEGGGLSPQKRPVVFPSAQQDLPPRARRLLEAARRLLEREGLNALTFEAIGREAGETSSLIRYYFGDKAGLLVALIDWVMHEELDEVRQLRERASAAEDRVSPLLTICQGLVHDTKSSVVFYELLPHLLRDERARTRLANLYSEYRDTAQTSQSPASGDAHSDDATTMAALTIAVTDGLMIQQLIQADAVDMVRAFALWETFVRLVESGRAAQLDIADGSDPGT